MSTTEPPRAICEDVALFRDAMHTGFAELQNELRLGSAEMRAALNHFEASVTRHLVWSGIAIVGSTSAITLAMLLAIRP